MMKLNPDDPRLSAYLLGELNSEEAAEVDRAAAADPAIQVSLNELQKTMGFLSDTLGGVPEQKLLPAQRQQVLRAGRDADQEGKVVELPSAKRGARPWLTGLAAAAAVTIAAVVLNRMGGESGTGTGSEWADEIALLPMPGPSAGEGMTMPGKGSSSETEMARQIESRGSQFLGEVARKLEQVRLPEADRLPQTTSLAGFSKTEELRLPVVLGSSSPAWVNRWMQERQEFPPKRLVRVEEFINAVSLRTSDEFKGLRYGLQVTDSPWNPDSRLIALQLEAGDMEIRDLEVRSVASTSRRVLGSFSRRSDEELPTLLPPRRSTLVMLEVEGKAESLGAIEIRLGEEMITIPVSSDSEDPSPGMARAVAMAAYALWLRGEIEEEELDIALTVSDRVDPGAVPRGLRSGIELAKSLREAGR